ncbi:MAG: hypothetical protein WBC91_10500 [Phototrophicaceae bacterium]
MQKDNVLENDKKDNETDSLFCLQQATQLLVETLLEMTNQSKMQDETNKIEVCKHIYEKR